MESREEAMGLVHRCRKGPILANPFSANLFWEGPGERRVVGPQRVGGC